MHTKLAVRRLSRGFVLIASLMLAGMLPAQAQEPIKIGSFLSVTGGAAFLGDPEQILPEGVDEPVSYGP